MLRNREQRPFSVWQRLFRWSFALCLTVPFLAGAADMQIPSPLMFFQGCKKKTPKKQKQVPQEARYILLTQMQLKEVEKAIAAKKKHDPTKLQEQQQEIQKKVKQYRALPEKEKPHFREDKKIQEWRRQIAKELEGQSQHVRDLQKIHKALERSQLAIRNALQQDLQRFRTLRKQLVQKYPSDKASEVKALLKRIEGYVKREEVKLSYQLSPKITRLSRLVNQVAAQMGKAKKEYLAGQKKGKTASKAKHGKRALSQKERLLQEVAEERSRLAQIARKYKWERLMLRARSLNLARKTLRKRRERKQLEINAERYRASVLKDILKSFQKQKP